MNRRRVTSLIMAAVAGASVGVIGTHADAAVTRPEVKATKANPNHVLPTPTAEAWVVYRTEIGNDGCWTDFAGTYSGMSADDTLPIRDGVEDDSYMVLDSILWPGQHHHWRPYDGGCTD